MMKFKAFSTKLKFFYLKLTGKIKKMDTSVEIISMKTNIKNILIIFPLKEDAFRVALYSFRNLKRKKNTNYYYLINSIHKNHFHLPGYVYDIYYNNKKNKADIDKYFVNEIVNSKKFEMVVDLNNEFIFDISYLINNISGYYKVGFKNTYSDYFYNIQLDLPTSSVLETSYSKINIMLD
jgi:hypothetical protein